MKFNPAQQDYLLKQSNRDVFVKARQLGITTWSVIDMLDDAIFVPNMTCALIAHRKEDVQKIFRIAKLAYDHFPENLKPITKYDNKNEIYFAEQNSIFYVALQIRGGSVDKLHISEAAHIKNFEEVYAASAESVPQDGVIRVETTAKGIGGHFYNMWTGANDGSNDYKPHFYGWNWKPEYSRSAEGIEFTADERALQVQYNLTDEQLSWRRWKMADLKKTFPQEYPLNAQEAFIASGGNRFDVELLQKLAQKVKVPLRQTEYVKYWVEPVAGRKYIAGTDCAKGMQTGDWTVTDIFDPETGEQCAQFRARIPIERATEESMRVCREYNNALWGIELQDHGFAMINIAKKEYENLYVRTKVNSTGTEDKKTKEYGWSTNGQTKPMMIGEFDTALHDGLVTINSITTLQECMSYIEDPDGRTNAAEGCHDDTVISGAVAWQMRKHTHDGFSFAIS